MQAPRVCNELPVQLNSRSLPHLSSLYVRLTCLDIAGGQNTALSTITQTQHSIQVQGASDNANFANLDTDKDLCASVQSIETPQTKS